MADAQPSPEEAVVTGGSNTVHQLKITLHGIRPPIWRRIEVPSDITLGELSPVLEAAMGWLGGHLHMFDIDGVTYGTPDPDWDTDELDEGEFRVSALLPFVESKMTWDYDFGDGWVHNVVVEAISPVEAAVLYPRTSRRQARLSAGGLRRRARVREYPRSDCRPKQPRQRRPA